ncbi:cytochrome c biogenesis protein ResB [Desulfoscipio geothermicus]|uniref:cytochrome c biogenesis protein ResB n=1 Tax=Desulfoscipio geothermicus TaxID=39060 RepID=UPI0013F4CEB7|nr:cytochrome c biogenesis protein ResB [Desulfoscipio geothermicus]
MGKQFFFLLNDSPFNILLFSSMRFGIALILVFSGVLALATILSSTSGSGGIYSSTWFILIVGLLCMNLIICTINRVNMLINSTIPEPYIKKTILALCLWDTAEQWSRTAPQWKMMYPAFSVPGAMGLRK